MNRMNALGVVGGCAVALLSSCSTFGPGIGKTQTFYVGPAMADCVGVGPMTCLMVKQSPESDYQMFSSPIHGFDYVSGYEYKLRVRVIERVTVPVDGSRYIHELIEVVSKTPAGIALEGTTWELVGRISRSKVFVRFENGTVTGSGGVNRFSGGYVLTGSSIKMGKTASNMMAAPQKLMDQELQFLGALEQAASYKIVGEELRLFNADGRKVLAFSPAVPDETALPVAMKVKE
ncbi:hypothetical protein PDESU_02356 [Pontiella desulfatans]|uniref:DUF4377 domain-containing protein n=1 Tax=Pontiella desulfatans TaxID=2750659 RepID=A0A6C2U1X4_PONDE|nr:DUF4377 domain-containing protein [Pontiella desulfatans]VGO13799.1 hypothetical protein PDESU_02356 [Pontiella desulfatans]